MNSSRNSALENFVRRSGPLYTMPAVALEVLTLTDDPRTDAARLKACIERDPALSAKLLRVVNSSLFGTARTITDLSQAVSLLGVKALKLLVLGFSLPEHPSAPSSADVLQRYWRRALSRAVAARELALSAEYEHGEEAFLCGLLADVGQLVLIHETDEVYPPLARSFEDRDELLAAERHAFGFDHRDLTWRLLEEWRLPTAIREAIRAATAAGERDAPATATARLVRTAELLVRLVADERAEVWPDVAHVVGRDYRLSTEQLVELTHRIEDQTAQLAEALHVRLAAATPAALTAAARRRMQPAAVATVADWMAGRHPPLVRNDRPTGLGRAAVLAAVADAEPPALLEEVRTTAVACRTCRAPLTLWLIDLQLAPESGAEPDPVWERLAVAALDVACREVDWPERRTLTLDVTQRACVLPRCDRRRGGELVAELQRRFRSLLPENDSAAMKLNVGWATVGLPPRGFLPEELITAARRCLQAAYAAAGDAAKSIELY